MRYSSEEALIEAASDISQRVLGGWAAEIDRQNRFPQESIDALREAGLLGFFVPASHGGYDGTIRAYSRIAALLGAGCLSTALIWAMHCQQVAVLAAHAAQQHPDVLTTIAQRGSLVASVTTEYGKGGDLLSAESPLAQEHGRLRLQRVAPIVSYGQQAAFYLITMRSGAERPANDVSLVLVTPADGEVAVRGEWNAMGMRGTCSVPMEFNVLVDHERVIGRSFREVALQTMVPVGHIGWASAWFGAARGAFTGFVRQLRSGKQRHKLKSDLFVSRLANLRVSLDLMDAMVYRVVDQYATLRQCAAPPEAYEDIAYNIALNNLKVAVSRLAFSVVEGLIELSGLSQGYLKNDSLGLERVFRDLKSAALMYHNDRLIVANGKLLLIEHTPMGAIWSRSSGGDAAAERA